MPRTGYKNKRFYNDEEADILGMPLYLLIIIIITVIGLGILVAWISMADTSPNKIDKIGVNSGQADATQITVSPTDLDVEGSATIDLTITVWTGDTKLKGATVSLSRCGTTGNAVPGKTADDGTVTFNGLEVTLAPGSQTCQMQVKCEKSGYSSYTGSIIVVRG